MISGHKTGNTTPYRLHGDYFPVTQASDLADEERKLLRTLEIEVDKDSIRSLEGKYTFMSICYDT